MADHQDFEEEDVLLQSALSSAFTQPPATRKTPAALVTPPSAAPSDPPPPPPAHAEPSSRAEEDSWKGEYEAHLQSWRAEAAVARKRAETERARWESLRAGQQPDLTASADWERVEGTQAIRGPPNPSFAETMPPKSPSPSDASDPFSSRQEGRGESDVTEGVSKPTDDDSGQSSPPHKWEEIRSLESSYPSLTFPERSKTPSPERRASKPVARPVPLPSATVSVFDTSLSTRTRFLALVSSLAINLFLPFVNGVMLGLGEIFAKSFVGRMGWKIPGGAATAVGVGAAASLRRR